MKLRTTVFVLVLFLSFIPTTIAEDDPPTPPVIPPYIKHTLVNPPWTYYDGTLIFWCLYIDESNNSIISSKIFIDSIPFDIYENDSSEYPSNKNFYYYNNFSFERKTYDFYFEIKTLNATATSFGTFDIVNRDPYLLETPPVKMDVYDEFEWQARAHDPDLDYITWSWSSNITDASEWEFEPNNTTMKLKIKCDSPFNGWVNVSITDNYTYDFWKWTLICYGVGQERSPPPIPRSKLPFTLGDIPPSTNADELPETLATSDFIPSGDGHEIDWTPKGGGNNFVEVDDAVGAPDGDTTYVSIAQGNQEDYYDIPDHGALSGTITNVRVVVRAKQTGAENIQICIQTVATEYCTANKVPGAGYGDETNDWANNPNSGIAWTWAQIDALQIGQKSKATGGWGGVMYVTQVYAIVTYNPLAATTYYWQGTIDGTWENPNNWEPNTDYPKDNDDWAYIDDGVNSNIDIQDGVQVLLVIGQITVNNTYTGTLTSTIDLTLDSAGTKDGSANLNGGTWDFGNNDLNIDGDWINNGMTISNPARHTFQGGLTQNVKSNGEIFYQVTVDNVGSTAVYPIDAIQMFDLTILSAGEYKIDSVTEGLSITHKFTDSANCGIVSSSTGTLTLRGDGVNAPTMTTSAGGAPTNYWINDMSSITATLDYATISYHTQGWTTSYLGAIDIEQTTYSNSKSAGQYSVSLRTATVTKFSDNTISNSGSVGLYVASQDVTNIVNLVISASGTSDIVNVGRMVELTTSNFDASKVVIQTVGDMISDIHNDAAGSYYIWATDFLKSAITNDFVSGDDVYLYSGKFIMNENGAADTVRFASGTTFQIGADTPTASRTLTFDDTAGAGFHTSSAGTLIGSGTVANEQYITSAATPPTDYWNGDMSTNDPAITMDYTTLSYGTLMNTGGTWNVDDSTFDNFKNTAYSVEIETGATITSFTDNTISNSAYGLDVQVAHTGFDNIRVTSMSNTDIRANDVDIEFTNSNFDVTQVNLASTGNVFSDVHDDMTNAFKVICSNADKSGISNDFGSADKVEIVSNGCAFTIDEDAELTDIWIQTNTVVTHDTATTWTISGNGNLSLNGSLVSSGIIEYSGASWFTFFVNYWAYLYLNTSTVINSDIVISFNYTIGANNYGAVNELNITQPVGADNIVNITQRDFSVKGSGTVLTFLSNNSASVNTHYTVTNLTTGEAYNVDINGTTVYTIDAASSQIGFSYASEGDRIIEIIWAANISGRPPGEDGGPIPVIFAGFTVEVTGDRMVCFNSSATYSTYEVRSYVWDFGDGSISTQENPCIRYEFTNPEKSYSVTLTVVDKFQYQNMTVQKVTSSNWNLYIGLGLMLFVLIAAMVRTTVDTTELRKKFKSWRQRTSRRFTR